MNCARKNDIIRNISNEHHHMSLFFQFFFFTSGLKYGFDIIKYEQSHFKTCWGICVNCQALHISIHHENTRHTNVWCLMLITHGQICYNKKKNPRPLPIIQGCNTTSQRLKAPTQVGPMNMVILLQRHGKSCHVNMFLGIFLHLTRYNMSPTTIPM